MRTFAGKIYSSYGFLLISKGFIFLVSILLLKFLITIATKSALVPSDVKHTGKILFCQNAIITHKSSLSTPVSLLNLSYSVFLPDKNTES